MRFGRSSDVSCCFVPDEGKWYSLEKMITKRSFPIVSSCQGLVYSLGGDVLNGPDNCDKVGRFDPAINTFADGKDQFFKCCLSQRAFVCLRWIY